MASVYLQGGDAYQILDHPAVAGQTFRVDSPLTLQWIDLNLKLGFKTPEVLIEIYTAGADHQPSGDPISGSRYWLINQPLPPRDWLWFEPWGKTLLENHYWLDQPHLDPPTITFKNGAITLVNTGRTAQWIDTLLSTTPFPLVDPSGNHLHFHHHSPISYGPEIYHWHSYTFKLEKFPELWTLEAIISHGTNWAPLNGDCGTTPLGSCFFEGQGPGVFDLTEQWIHCRTFHGLDADPTGWKLHDLHLRIESVNAIPGGTLQNNFCGLARQQFTPVPYDDYNVLPSVYTWPNQLYRVRFCMEKVLLTPEFYYFMRVVAFPGLLEMAHYWQYDKDDSTYPQGIRLSSNDGGDTWTKHFNDDHLFAAFGAPPAPPAPPDPPLPNWCILLVTQTRTATGYKITCWTNVPCHLYMFWTNEEPQKHMRTRIVRGLSVLDTPAYCFVEWHQNEQEEAGDTIYHTFIKEPWPECETRWYTFRALVNNEWSPSAGPIFKKHRTLIDFGPPVWIECPYLDTNYFAKSVGETWLEAKTSFPTYDYCHGTPGAENNLFGLEFRCSRSCFEFDSSAIPIGSIICEAKMQFIDQTHFWWLGHNGNYYIYLLDANDWDSECEKYWYLPWHNWNAVLAKYFIAENQGPTAKEIQLTELANDRIVPGGKTKFLVKMHWDKEEIDAIDGARHYDILAQAPYAPPKLLVQYMPPL